jgi:hypothetical protein
VNSQGRRPVVDGLLLVIVFATTFFYRFNSLGGAFGGFTNDEFGYLARGRQIQGGDLPFRDFNDPGWFLTDVVAGLAQWVGGYNLRSEALLTVGMLALGAAITFALARRAAGSVVAAAIAIAIHIGLDARHYNYPKIVLYAAAIAAAWAYVDRPGFGRAAALGAVVGVAFLFRHDHLAYLGALALMTIAIVHRASPVTAIRAMAGTAGAAAVFIGPFLVFVALNGGVSEYFRTALVYATRDAERTSFDFPRITLGESRPLVRLTRDTPPMPRVNVRWLRIPDAQRRDREARYALRDGAAVDGNTWTYALGNASPQNIQALVQDPVVEDTHGVDRTAFAIASSERLRLETPFDALPNATAFLYYAFLALPLLCALVLWRLRGMSGSTLVLRDPEYLVPLLVLAAIINVTFMSRGSTNIRIPDVSVTAAILLAWLTAAVASRDGRALAPRRPGRLLMRAALAVGLCLTVLSTNGLAQGARTARDAGFTAPAGQLLARARTTWNRLGADPRVFANDPEQPDILRLAAYVDVCTSPDDRLFVLAEYPALYYFSDRRFAGGHAWLLPQYYSDPQDETAIVRRLQASRVPIVITEGQRTYDEEYRPVFDQIHAYLQREYVEAREVDVGSAGALRVLVRAGMQPVRQYRPLNLPCFAAAR